MRSSSGTAEGLGDRNLFEGLAQLGDLLPAVALDPAPFDLGEETEAERLGFLAQLRKADQRGVGRFLGQIAMFSIDSDG